jgi:hypothetical protein
VPEVWIPGAAGPLDQFVERLHRRIAEFASKHGLADTAVEVELSDGALISVESISPEPGFGFVTLRPHGDEPAELIVPIGVVREIRLGVPEPDRARFGFSLPPE